MKQLTKIEEKVLNVFSKLAKKQVPSNKEIAIKTKCSIETARVNLYKLANKGYVKLNKKLRNRKFSLK